MSDTTTIDPSEGTQENLFDEHDLCCCGAHSKEECLVLRDLGRACDVHRIGVDRGTESPSD